MEAILSEENTKLNVLRFGKNGTSYAIENHGFYHVDLLNGDFDSTASGYYTEVLGIPGPWYLVTFANALYNPATGPKDVFAKPTLPGWTLIGTEAEFEQDIRDNFPRHLLSLNKWRTELFKRRVPPGHDRKDGPIRGRGRGQGNR